MIEDPIGEEYRAALLSHSNRHFAKDEKSKPKPKRKSQSAAVLTIREAGNFTPRGRRAIVRWIRKQADFLSKWGKHYDKRFIARYLYGQKM